MGEINRWVFTKWIICLTCMIALQACKHPLAIVGEGDIVDANNSGHGCTLEQFQAQDTACTENEVSGDYIVNYKAVPRSNWRFVRWEGPCSPQSDFQHCRLDISEDGVTWWEENHPQAETYTSTAVFEPITGETGFLVAGAAVAGVTWETPTQQGVTGSNGRFQYEEGETVRFMIGDTVLGEVTGQDQVTPFELAGSAVITGASNITEALDNERDPFNAVTNITVLLQSLDEDARPKNGIEVRPGVAALFQGVSLDVAQHWETFPNEFGLRHALGQANTRHRFSVVHGVAKPELALQHLYETLRIDPRISGWRRVQGDRLGDGTVDEVQSWQYDSNGYVTRYEGPADVPLGSSTGALFIFEFDAGGNLTKSKTAVEAQGSDSEWRWIHVESRQYNTYGNLIQLVHGDNDDGVPHPITQYEYNAEGSLTRAESGYSGNPDRIERHEYDNQGNLTRSEYDYDYNGAPDRVEHYEYNDQGLLASYESDSGGVYGGDRIMNFEYDDRGNLTRSDSDRPSDDKPSMVTRYNYDGQGNLTRKQRGLTIESWQYDRNNNLTSYVKNSWPFDLPDGSPEQIDSWLYDARGYPTSKKSLTYRSDGSQHIQSWQYQFDANGNLTREDREGGGYGDDTGIFTQTWQYDAEDNVTRHDSGGNVTTYEYEATRWGHIFTDFLPIVPGWLPEPAPPSPFPPLP
jgi:hypothetical protein